MLHHLILISKHLKAREKDRLLRPVVLPMQDVYLKYRRDIPMLYSFAFILDPRAKLKGFQNVLRLLSKTTGTDYSGYFTEVRANLPTVFKQYEDKFGAVRIRRPEAPCTGKKKTLGMTFFLLQVMMIMHLTFSQVLVTPIAPLSLCLEGHLLLSCCSQKTLVHHLVFLWVFLLMS
jgi:hypothetical protein